MGRPSKLLKLKNGKERNELLAACNNLTIILKCRALLDLRYRESRGKRHAKQAESDLAHYERLLEPALKDLQKALKNTARLEGGFSRLLERHCNVVKALEPGESLSEELFRFKKDETETKITGTFYETPNKGMLANASHTLALYFRAKKRGDDSVDNRKHPSNPARALSDVRLHLETEGRWTSQKKLEDRYQKALDATKDISSPVDRADKVVAILAYLSKDRIRKRRRELSREARRWTVFEVLEPIFRGQKTG